MGIGFSGDVDVAFGAAYGTRTIAGFGLFGIFVLLQAAYGEAYATAAHQARSFFFVEVAFAMGVLCALYGDVMGGGEVGFAIGDDIGTCQRHVISGYQVNGVTTDGGAQGLGIGDAVYPGAAAGTEESTAFLLLHGVEVGGFFAGVKGDVLSGAQVDRALFAGDVGSGGGEILPRLKVYVAKGVDGAADVLALLGVFCMAVMFAVGAEGLAALGLQGLEVNVLASCKGTRRGGVVGDVAGYQVNVSPGLYD